MFELLPKWMYQCLDNFGNTIISEKIYKRYGEKKILEELKRNGYICKIVICENFDIELAYEFTRKKTKTYVIELREKCDVSTI